MQVRLESDTHKQRDPTTDRLSTQTARLLLECNFRCPFCFAAWHEEEVKPPEEVMNNVGEKWRKYLDATKAKGYERLTVSGGEPTMHPEILPLLRYARELGFESIELQTNASLVTPRNARKLRKAGVTDALVSLHSHREEIFDRITVTEGVFDTVIAGIKQLLEAGINVMISHVIIKWNVDDLVEFVRFCHREFPGMREILFFSMQPEARAAKNMHIWPHLPRVREMVPAALDECVNLGVGYRIDSQEGYPMCFLTGHEHRVDLYDVTNPEGTFGDDLNAFQVIERKKVKLPQCGDCYFEKACYGFWEGYFMLYGTEGVEPVARTERLAGLFPFLESPAPEEAATAAPESNPELMPVRKPHDHTWLEDEDVEQFPLPWREGRAAAQRIK